MWYATARPPLKIARPENGNLDAPQILMNAANAQLFNTAVTIHPPSYNVNAQFITTTTAGGEMKLAEYSMPSPATANVTQSESQVQGQPANYVTSLGMLTKNKWSRFRVLLFTNTKDIMWECICS